MQSPGLFMFGVTSDLVICKFTKKYGHTCHRMSLLTPGVIKQHKRNTTLTMNAPHLQQTCWQKPQRSGSFTFIQVPHIYFPE